MNHMAQTAMLSQIHPNFTAVDNQLRRLEVVFGLTVAYAENEDIEDTIEDDVDLSNDEP